MALNRTSNVGNRFDCRNKLSEPFQPLELGLNHAFKEAMLQLRGKPETVLDTMS